MKFVFFAFILHFSPSKMYLFLLLLHRRGRGIILVFPVDIPHFRTLRLIFVGQFYKIFHISPLLWRRRRTLLKSKWFFNVLNMFVLQLL
jgi:hypothetical protein